MHDKSLLQIDTFVAFANILFRKQLLSPAEFAVKMQEIERRWTEDRANEQAAARL